MFTIINNNNCGGVHLKSAMGLQKFQIEVHNNNALSFFPGQTIFGALNVATNKDCKNDGNNLISIKKTLPFKKYKRLISIFKEV